MKKVLTISIAAYNVEKYIRKSLDSLLIKDIDKLEILVEDDGGTDGTADIVKEYEKRYPYSIKLIHKKNGGYGSTINKSLEIATGKYFKQLDGDDWYSKKGLQELVNKLETIDDDVIYTPIVNYWDDTEKEEINDGFKRLKDGTYKINDVITEKDYLQMHNIMYKTNLLKKTKLKLFEKCFYTDIQYALIPLYSVDTIYVSHTPLYYYRLGLGEQSVSISGRIKHCDDQIKVAKDLIKYYKNKKKLSPYDNYANTYVEKIETTTLSNFIILIPDKKQGIKKYKEFDNYIYNNNRELYKNMENHGKIVKLMRLSKYNYMIYCIISKLKLNKMKKKK